MITVAYSREGGYPPTPEVKKTVVWNIFYNSTYIWNKKLYETFFYNNTYNTKERLVAQKIMQQPRECKPFTLKFAENIIGIALTWFSRG